jgi:fructose-bisphosphate aldolase class 1
VPSTQGNNIIFSRGVNPDPPAPSLASLTLSASSVNAPNVLTGTVTLTEPAPKGNAKVTIASSNSHAVAGLPQVVVLAGQRQAQFLLIALPTASQVTVTISASYGGATDSAPLTLDPFRVVSHQVDNKF